ncbi:alpha-glucosidase [Aliiglaciecola sp. 2_MG-2023]|uniref:glycoside hydrolase family 13 protein n=1 Tax=unclassified Aliiglaciecola TaxID=2593648 RepID=UPI0026E2855E|nr:MULTISPECIES: alpha-glucosidase [unclassified Aliiglaciecola]MDO6710146.1 alpha-glucosidase [Aliiglaciecola sp. 2_MG-2023]MDO6751294.1 alpha-glucosidase [Aliiglaciecola sp. 1_MG-2023]
MTTSKNSLSKKWWKEQIIYQIYPRSFFDSDGDGIGDLNGIIEKLDYIKSLGVTAVWVNPFYASPNDDNGYDISDYRKIMDEFGDMNDFDEMIKGFHQRGIKFIMDLVVNHSSDEHEWFKQSRSSRYNLYRDYYHWWPAEKGKPNHRFSYFDEKGDAWKYDEQTDSYYLHYFSAKQPDLNWENPELRREIYDIMHFWAKKGVDGFRLDAFQFTSKDTTFPAFPEGYQDDVVDVIKHHGMGPTLHNHIREMNQEVLSKYEVFAVSEGAGSSFEDAHSLVDEDRNELHMVYHFEGVEIGNGLDDPHTLADFKEVHSKWEEAFKDKGWISIFLANHDVPRMVSRFGNDSDEFRAVSSKMLNTFILTMRGTPYCYFGDELGMKNIYFEDINEYQDIAAINGYKKALSEGKDMQKFMQNLRFYSRDNSRTPMQWDNTENAGFTSGSPWISVNSDYKEVNVASQENRADSVLNHFRTLTKLRTENDILVYGVYQQVEPDHPHIYAYTRSLDNQTWLVILSFVETDANLKLPNNMQTFEIQANNYSQLSIDDGWLKLKPYQAVVLSQKE